MFSDYNEKKKEFEERTKRNRDNWTASNSIGDTQGANAAHEAQKQNVEEWDKYTGGKSTYDEESGVWKYSDAPDRAATMHMNNGIQRGEQGLREREFNYNVYDDPMFQEYIKTARRNGQAAMTDTMAKGAAMTGGIAGSYAVAAGANAYNEYMERANDIIPELEQIAYQRYQNELARDREIYEMDEAKRWEKANVDAVLQDYQTNGTELTPEARAILSAAGMYVDANGDIVDGYGNHYVRGTKYKEEEDKAKRETANAVLFDFQYNNKNITGSDIAALEAVGWRYEDGAIIDSEGNRHERNPEVSDFQELYDTYDDYGWSELNAESRREFLENGYLYDERTGMIYNDEGYYRNQTSSQADILLANYMMGMELTSEQLEVILSKPGYGYNEQTGKITYLGEDIDRAREVVKSDASGSGDRPGSGTAGDVYVAKEGDTLGEIAKAHGVPVNILAAYNGIPNPNEIKIGQKIEIPDASWKPPVGTVSPPKNPVQTQEPVVDDGDTAIDDGPKNTTNPKTGEDYISSGVADTVAALIVAGRYDDAEKELENAVKSGEMNEYEAKQLLKDYWNILRGGE